jgi:hypothetical protein
VQPVRRSILPGRAGSKSCTTMSIRGKCAFDGTPGRDPSRLLGCRFEVGLLAESKNMKSGPHRNLEAWPGQLRGAGSARFVRAAVTCTGESRLRRKSSTALSCSALSAAVGVASFGAGLRPAPRPWVRVASRIAVQRGVAVRSVNSGVIAARLLRPASLPNNSLEPTLETTATSLRVGSGAAQLKR